MGVEAEGQNPWVDKRGPGTTIADADIEEVH